MNGLTRLLAFRCERSAAEQLAELARRGDRSLSAEIRRACREHVARFQGDLCPRFVDVDPPGLAVGSSSFGTARPGGLRSEGYVE